MGRGIFNRDSEWPDFLATIINGRHKVNNKAASLGTDLIIGLALEIDFLETVPISAYCLLKMKKTNKTFQLVG